MKRSFAIASLLAVLGASCGLEDTGGAPLDASAGTGAVGLPDATQWGGSGGTTTWPDGGGVGGNAGVPNDSGVGGTGGLAGNAGTGATGGGTGGIAGTGGGGGTAGAGGSTGWTPALISGCTLWLDASDASSVVTSGTSVQLWKDKCSGHDATGAGSSKPQLTPQLLNGLAGAQFDGVDDFLEIGGTATTPSAFCLFFLIKTTHWGQLPVWSNRGSPITPGDSPTFFGISSFAPFLYQDKVVPPSLVTGAPVPAKPSLLELWVDAAGRRILLDGTPVAEDSVTVMTATPIPNGFLAADQPNGTRLTVDIFEVVMYAAAVSPVDASTLRSYLKSKWGL